MKVPALLFLVTVSTTALGLSGCGVSETDANRFETAAERIASIPLDPTSHGEAEAAPRKREPLRLELLTPHQLWDARDGRKPQASRVIALAESDLEMAEGRVMALPTEEPSPEPVVRAPLKVVEVAPSATPRVVQLGAYASQSAAEAAWSRLGAVTQGMTPVFEPVTVNGRPLVRLKVRAQSQQAQALCAVAAASDAWCMKAAS